MKFGVADYGMNVWDGGCFDIEERLIGLKKIGYDGWVFVEHDTHLQDPFKDLAISREYLRKAGF